MIALLLLGNLTIECTTENALSDRCEQASTGTYSQPAYIQIFFSCAYEQSGRALCREHTAQEDAFYRSGRNDPDGLLREGRRGAWHFINRKRRTGAFE